MDSEFSTPSPPDGRSGEEHMEKTDTVKFLDCVDSGDSGDEAAGFVQKFTAGERDDGADWICIGSFMH